MMRYLGGPETLGQIEKRHERYVNLVAKGTTGCLSFLVGPRKQPAGSVGYWEGEWQEQKVWETAWSVLPEFQGQGLTTKATQMIIKKLRQLGTQQFLYAYPSVENGASNAICRNLGFVLQGSDKFEYPKVHCMICSSWRLDLFQE